jgi:tetratricopeptide (TPR) repeat protein
MVPVLILSLFLAFTRKESLEKIVLFLVSAVMTAGLVLVLAYSLPGKDTAPVFLPPRAGYAIALETLKNTSTALLGYGPENFVNAYNRTRPAFLNLSDFWNVRFTSSSNELFHADTTAGLVGLVAWVLVTVSVVRAIRAHESSQIGKVVKLITAGLLFLLILVPGTYPHLFALFVLLMLWSILMKANRNPQVADLELNLNTLSIVRPEDESGATQNPVPVLPYLIGVPVLILSAVILYFAGKAYTGEMIFKQSLDAAAQNQGLETYNLQREAIIQNPYVTRYRRAYSATNLALANSISSQEELSDEDRANVSQLIQQSIREAKAAVTLDPLNSANWENLTFVYRSLINVAEGADSWTIASLAQAIQNDPVNPRLRLELGGVYYALGRYDQAIRLYQQAAELKPDWANAYFNLSAAHKQKGELTQAFDYMRQVLTLVDPETADYSKAQEELESLADALNVPEDEVPVSQPLTELNTPEPIPTTSPENQVELPENTGPENLQGQPAATTGTPAPTPTGATTTPQPTPAQ